MVCRVEDEGGEFLLCALFWESAWYVFIFKGGEDWRIVGGRGGFKYLHYIHNVNLCSFLPR